MVGIHIALCDSGAYHVDLIINLFAMISMQLHQILVCKPAQGVFLTSVSHWSGFPGLAPNEYSLYSDLAGLTFSVREYIAYHYYLHLTQDLINTHHNHIEI